MSVSIETEAQSRLRAESRIPLGAILVKPLPPQTFPAKVVTRDVVMVAGATWGHPSDQSLEVGSEGIGVSEGETGS